MLAILAPRETEYVPGRHDAHRVKPAVSPYVPAAHAKQLEASVNPVPVA